MSLFRPITVIIWPPGNPISSSASDNAINDSRMDQEEMTKKSTSTAPMDDYSSEDPFIVVRNYRQKYEEQAKATPYPHSTDMSIEGPDAAASGDDFLDEQALANISEPMVDQLIPIYEAFKQGSRMELWRYWSKIIAAPKTQKIQDFSNFCRNPQYLHHMVFIKEENFRLIKNVLNQAIPVPQELELFYKVDWNWDEPSQSRVSPRKIYSSVNKILKDAGRIGVFFVYVLQRYNEHTYTQYPLFQQLKTYFIDKKKKEKTSQNRYKNICEGFNTLMREGFKRVFIGQLMLEFEIET